MIQQAVEFGRVRLEQGVSAELMRILYEERDRCLREKSDPTTSELRKEYLRYRLHSITRIWKEAARMMEELGWERP
jgi:hypothetical protein